MEHIKIAQVGNVELIRRGQRVSGTLHLTAHHMIFRESEGSNREIWICYPIIHQVSRQPFSGIPGHSRIRIAGKDFTFMAFDFQNAQESRDVYDSLVKLTGGTSASGGGGAGNSGAGGEGKEGNNGDRLYAYMYKPGSLERTFNGWDLYDFEKEYTRMGAFSTLTTSGASGAPKWRVTKINEDYTFCPSYPAYLVVPNHISDTVLKHAGKFRSKCRIPVLSYLHEFNQCTITRCSQPMVGIKQNRSVQDEKVIEAIFVSSSSSLSSKLLSGEQASSSTESSGSPVVTGQVFGEGQKKNLIVDARPITNAMAQTALGGGTEHMDNYKPAKKIYLGIDNIHVMRDSLNKIFEALNHGDLSAAGPNMELMYKSQWLQHVRIILQGAVTIAQQVHYNFSHVVVHCSDGWDRTPQLTSLAQVFLDPYFRTIEGFIVLIEKEWLSFGHRFAERSGIYSEGGNSKGGAGGSGSDEGNGGISGSTSDADPKKVAAAISSYLSEKKRIKYSGPIFHQFLDCIYQVLCQFPTEFEYNERFLRRLLYHVYSCQYGTFLSNSERERAASKANKKTRSAWDYFLARKRQFVNDKWKKHEQGAHVEETVIFVDPAKVKWWAEMFGRTDEEMNGSMAEEEEAKKDGKKEEIRRSGERVETREDKKETVIDKEEQTTQEIEDMPETVSYAPKSEFPVARIGKSNGAIANASKAFLYDSKPKGSDAGLELSVKVNQMALDN